MFHTILMTDAWSRHSWLAQTAVGPTVAPGVAAPGVVTPEQSSVFISGPHFFIALIAGILLAFAIQLMLTNLSVAAGISFVGRTSGSDKSDKRDHNNDHNDKNDKSDGIGTTIRKISFGLGLWTLITVCVALFIACFLAVQLSLLFNPLLGAIVGLVIWAAYFSLLVWFSSSTVGSLIGSIVNSATAGFQAILGTAAAALGGNAVNRQVVATAEAAAAAVRNELGSAIDPNSIRDSVESYVQRLRLPDFNMGSIRRDFENLLNDPAVHELAESGNLNNINRQTFVDLVSRRSDFSSDEINRFADVLEGVWRQTLGRRPTRNQTQDLISYLQSAQPGQVKLNELNDKIDRVLEENRRLRQTISNQQGGSGSGQQQSADGPIQQALSGGTQAGLSTLMALVMGRTDLSDLNVEKIIQRIKSAQGQISEQTSKLTGDQSDSAYGTIRSDIENYLYNAHSWQMTSDRIAREFRDVLYDPTANPREIYRQLSRITRSDFVDILASRGVFTQDKIQRIADQLEKIRREVMSVARGAEEREIALDLRRQIETYLSLTPKAQLLGPDANNTLPSFKTILETYDADYETMSLRLMPYDRETLRQKLMERQDLTPAELDTILNTLDETRNRALAESQSLAEQTKQQTEEMQRRLEDYLRNTGKEELSPEGIKRDLQTLFEDPQTGLAALRYRASNFDRETYVQLLSQRQDLTQEDAQRVIDQVESSWNSVLHSPQILAGKAREQYEQTTAQLADYLRRTNLDELNPDGIRRDISTLMEDPREGTMALRRRLSQVDRETLVRLLAQRPDLSEEQVNRIIDQVEEAIREIIRAPRRLARRAQQQVMDFEASIEDYLRNTEKDELNPDGIKRDLQLLTQNPKLGMQTLADRLSRFDRYTLISLLSQRQDMSEAEAERVVGQFESVRDQIVNQVRQVQYRMQSMVDSIFARIRDYLNSLERPELNYEGVRRDVQLLFDDPQAGFEALRLRLGQFDRNTMVAILSSRPDISEAQANRLIDQIEGARNNVLQRAEHIQTETQRRLEDLKREVEHQAEETRKAAETASWWLFATAVFSAASSAIAGALAVL